MDQWIWDRVSLKQYWGKYASQSTKPFVPVCTLEQEYAAGWPTSGSCPGCAGESLWSPSRFCGSWEGWAGLMVPRSPAHGEGTEVVTSLPRLQTVSIAADISELCEYSMRLGTCAVEGGLQTLVGSLRLAVGLSVTPWWQAHCSAQCPAKFLPHFWHKLVSAGIPWIWNTWSTNSSAVSAAEGHKMYSFEKWSTIVSIVSLPWDGGNPVTKSKAMWDMDGQALGADGQDQKLADGLPSLSHTWYRSWHTHGCQMTWLAIRSVIVEESSTESTRMAGKLGCVTPLEDLRKDRDGHKHYNPGTSTRIWVSTRSCLYQGLNLLSQGANKTRWREDGVWHRWAAPVTVK